MNYPINNIFIASLIGKFKIFSRCTLLCILSSIFFSFTALAQNKVLKISIKWSENQQRLDLISGKNLSYPYSKELSYSSNRPFTPEYYFSQKFVAGDADYKISNEIYSPILNSNEALQSDSLIKNTLVVDGGIDFEKKESFFYLKLVPIRKTNSGGFEKLESFDLEIISKPNSNRKAGIRTYASNSVLSTGKWVKIGLTENGIYQLSYDFLKSLGIDVDNINSANFRVYGNAGGMLPEPNIDFIYDDLAENAIMMVDGGDGKINQGDKILFYGRGPDQWKINTQNNQFKRTKNPYSDTSYYFITTDLGVGKRIQGRNSSTLTPNFTLTTFNDFQIHEVDKITAISKDVKSGRHWFGEDFEFQNEYSFDFNFPNLITSTPLYIESDLVGRSDLISLTTQIKLNNALIGNVNTFGTNFSIYDSPFGSMGKFQKSSLSSIDNNKITIAHNKVKSDFNVWIDFVSVNAERRLKMTNNQMMFRNKIAFVAGNIVNYIVEGPDKLEFWDVSDPVNVKKQLMSDDIINYDFTFITGSTHEFIAFNNKQYLSPINFGSVANQNLHNIGTTTMVIVAPTEFLPEAERLAQHRRNLNGFTVQIINQQQLFNEFSSGSRDAGALRNFMKMLYDRAGTDLSKLPRFLLLFGDGSFDNKNRIASPDANRVMTYQSYESLSRTNSYVSDDYFGFMDDNEGEMKEDRSSIGRLDIGIGRFCINSLEQARDQVDKIFEYESKEATGDWRNLIALAADNGDGNEHLKGAEVREDIIFEKNKIFNTDKFYMDAFAKQVTPGGDRYPTMTEAINQKINKGVLILNYIGHGGEVGWTAERVIGIADVNSWSANKKFPIIFTATCSFTRWDDPDRVSAGELAFLNRNGAISMFTTTRIVFISENNTLNNNFYFSLFDPKFATRKPTMGELVAMSKNKSSITINDRNFTLLGDPSLEVPIPLNKIIASSINNKPISPTSDTLKALGKYTIKGIITDINGNKLNNYNGLIYPTIYDQVSKITTLNQEAASPKITFDLRKNVLYKGTASVINGDYSFTFIVPKDVSFKPGNGKLSFYAAENTNDAGGYYDSISIGGISALKDIVKDELGPDVKVFLDDKKFVSGGMVNNNPVLLVSLADSSGINTVGNSIGHDLTATISKDGGKERIINLNEFYAAKLDSYQQGEIKYPLTNLEAGNYTLKVKAWDVFNNSNETSTNFFVSDGTKLSLNRIYNYPNPFTTSTIFQFEHNKTGDQLDIMIKIFTVSGKLINTLSKKIVATGNRVDDIKWDGKDQFGDKLARGVYIYQLKVRSSDGSSADKYEKLVIL